MFDTLYLIFIAPIEWVMRIVIEVFFDISGSYGLAIIALSISANFVILPLYNIAEKWQVQERNMRAKLAPKIKEIKTAFKGQERFYMLKTLYRQNNYHPIISVRTSFGFLIQVPFFIAAYSLLNNYEDLQKISFLIFSDLSQADGVLEIAGNKINVMPIVMTVINLLSAFVYTKGFSKNELIQLYLIAFVFLVVLYGSPVALVFYWTVNNIFSLLKNIVYQKFYIVV